MIIELSKEYTLGSKKYKEINLDFDSLTGNDLLECSRNYKMRTGKAAESFKDFDDPWGLSVAEKASGIKYGDLLKLGASDFLKILNQTKKFLTKGWDIEEEKKNREPQPQTEM